MSSEVQSKIQIDVDPNILMTLKVQEFDKKIAEAKAVVADLERQKAVYIYDTNIQAIISQAQQAKTQQNPIQQVP